MHVQACEAFLSDYLRASAPLANLAEKKVADLIRRIQASPDWMRGYDKVEGLGRRKVLEIDLAGGPRLLAHVGSSVTLWRMGTHEITTRARNFDARALGQIRPLPPAFLPTATNPLLPPDFGQDIEVYRNELAPNWIYTLDDHQTLVGRELIGDIEQALLEGRPFSRLIFGGAGTGKTTLLLWLLKHLTSVDQGRESWDVRLLISDEMASMIESFTAWDLSPFLGLDDGSVPDVVLVDDPSSKDRVHELMMRLKGGEFRSLVIAMDPLQLNESISDRDLKAICERTQRDDQIWLDTCYRQKVGPGSAAQHVASIVAGSSPFLDETKKRKYAKERAKVTRRANSARLVNPSGVYRTYSPAGRKEFDSYLKWLRQQPRGPANGFPEILVVYDASVGAPWPVPAKVAARRVSTDDIESIKGLEYRHVMMVLGSHLHRSLQEGFEGSGRRNYNRFRLMRIAFTRAKDSLALFVVPQ